jgi:predicted GNAT family acetyltransferase
MSTHRLDRAVWDSLNTRHSRFSVGGELARKFTADIGPLAASRDDSPESLAALAELVPAEGSLILLQAEPIHVPPGIATVSTAEGVQMVADEVPGPGPAAHMIKPLYPRDYPEMFELATLTKPGPFERNTARLGEFWAIHENGRIAAMAGERMRNPGFCEVSAVCVHPDFRGRGFGRELTAHVARLIIERGEQPFLHAYSTNTGAIQLYETLGFQLRAKVNVAVIARG